MMVAKLFCVMFIQSCLWMLLVSSLTRASESDVNCLKTLKSQLQDPNSHLSSWEYENITRKGYICTFYGVNCWSDDENKVLSIDLGGFGLEGEFPRGLKECSSLVGLNMTGNKLSGTLPSDLFSFLPYLTTLDLSNNSFFGEIPATWSNLAYINVLLLDHNQFTGQIPTGVASSPRLRQFSVADNDLEGPIPEFTNASLSALSFQDNPGLCGFPLDPCQDSSFSINVIIAIISAAVTFPVGAAIDWFCIGIGIGKEQKQIPRRR